MATQAVNPATEAVLARLEETPTRAIEQSLQRAYEAQRRWRATSFGERAARRQGPLGRADRRHRPATAGRAGSEAEAGAGPGALSGSVGST